MMRYAMPMVSLPSGRLAKHPQPQAGATSLYAESLIMCMFDGDIDAFSRMVASVQRTAYYLLKSEEAAEDVVQESLIKAMRALPSFRGGNIHRWFRRILINSCYDLLRAQKRRLAVSLDELSEDGESGFQVADARGRPETHMEQLELRHLLERGMARLPDEQRITLVLHDVEGYSYEEIAGMTGVPIGTVKSRLNRGRIRMRDYLVRHHVLPDRMAS